MRFEPAQSRFTNLGKAVRITPDGLIPQDNPIEGPKDALGDVWSFGHRNALFAAIDPTSGWLWIVEMGPRGGDELNLVERGQNYGWPIVSNGSHCPKRSLPIALTMIPSHAADDEY